MLGWKRWLIAKGEFSFLTLSTGCWYAPKTLEGTRIT